MAPLTDTILQFTRSMEILIMLMQRNNLTDQNHELVFCLLKDITTSSYRLTDGVCRIADHPTYLNRPKRQIITSIMLLLTTVGTFFLYIIPSMHQNIQPRHLTTIQRHLQTLDIRTASIDNQIQHILT